MANLEESEEFYLNLVLLKSHRRVFGNKNIKIIARYQFSTL